jgi:hypothetical protein
MPLLHVVVRGEHLASIAERYGFENFETIWNAPENSELRKHRENPSTLLPGDEVLVPDKTEPAFARPAAQSHKFVVHVPQTLLRLRVLDLYGDPVASTDGVLTIDGRGQDVTTDGDGRLEIPIRRDARSAHLALGTIAFDLSIGALDPLPEDTGIEQRLGNLGYPTRDPDDDGGEGVEHAEQLALAVELFQDDSGVTPDGEADATFVDRLGKRYGC